jgi:lysophospholipase L1-like esterase
MNPSRTCGGASRRRRTALAALAGLAATCLTLVPLGAAPAAAAEPVRIMPVGDSITEGFDGNATYRYFLWHQLVAAGRSVDFVGSRTGVSTGTPLFADFDQDSDGHAGFRADQILDGKLDRPTHGRLSQWVAAYRPDIVIVHIGTNDIRQCESVASTVAELERIVATVRAARPSAAVLLARIIPAAPDATRTCAAQVAQRIVDLNAQVATLALRLSTAASPVVAVDQHTGFDVAADTTDGVHPNESGEVKVANRWSAALAPLLGPRPSVPSDGYWMLGAAGAVHPFGAAPRCGDLAGTGRTALDLEPFPDGRGYWVLDRGATVTAFACDGALPPGRAAGGSFAGRLVGGERPVSMSALPDGKGYWVFTDQGRAIPTGTAGAHGGMGGTRLNGPVLDSVATPSGRGYWMVASDGGIFAFGDATFAGSMGDKRLNQPVMSMAPDPDGDGYWLVASDGGVFAFSAPFLGSMGNVPLNSPVSGMVGSASGLGYLMVARDGGAFTFGDVPFHGSLGSNPPPDPVIAIAVR